MNQVEPLDQQRNVIDRMREHSRKWQEYEQNAPMPEYYDAVTRSRNVPQTTDDPSPYVETLHWAAWLIGALVAVLLFGTFAVYVYRTWQTPDPVLTFVQPKKNPRFVK